MGERLPGFERTLSQAMAQAVEIVQEAQAEHKPTKTFLLYSGGNDSQVLLHALAPLADGIVHVNTTIGVPEVRRFCRATASNYPLPYLEYRPPKTWRELVLTDPSWRGMPGPGAHRYTYVSLKERCFDQLLRDHRSYRGERFLLLSGIRRAESGRRSRRVAVERKGGRVWANPLLNVDNNEMDYYRKIFDLPVSEVAANLHMSGECLCGAMADQGSEREERAMLRFFYPHVHRYIGRVEQDAERLGLPYVEWGVKRPKAELAEDARASECGSMLACQSCAWRQESFALSPSPYSVDDR
jgi:3'-phosphoadenosine 5'-phosphosulfate sulfotransferase (PAPS reductase)/FAD synthetase